MSWRWRRSLGRGPFRISFTTKGVGVSVGVPGLRVGRAPDGRMFISQGIPGTGLYRIRYFGPHSVTGTSRGRVPVGRPKPSPVPSQAGPLARARAVIDRISDAFDRFF